MKRTGRASTFASLSAVFAVLAGLLALAPAASARRVGAHGQTRYAKLERACRAPGSASASCFAIVRRPVAASAAHEPGVSASTAGEGEGPTGSFTPAQLSLAYGYTPTYGGDGQTVAIVDAYDDPAIESNLASFDTEYGLTACTSEDGCFEKIGQTGTTTSLPPADKTGWSIEITLDVETVHSVCEGCKILLVEATSESYADLATAVDEAVAKGATEVSNSYGGPEGSLGAYEREAYDHPGVVIAAATGDEGFYDWDRINKGATFTPQRPDNPASLPTVVAVGGTTLELGEHNHREAESVWNGDGPGDQVGKKFAEGASGGGCSKWFTAPEWQRAVAGYQASGCAGDRLAADVSADADPNTGFDIYDTYNCGQSCEGFGIEPRTGWITVGGTSLATPLISALYGLAGGSGGIPFPALTLYGHLGQSSLFDVTSGGNGYCDAEPAPACEPPKKYPNVDCAGSPECDAAVGYDGPSGVGTPEGLGAFEPQFPTAMLTPPATTVAAGEAAPFSASGSSDPYPGGSLASYTWSWGDKTSTTASGPKATHAFALGGTYKVTLTVTDSYGVSGSATAEVTVHEGQEEEEARLKREAEEAQKAKEAQEAQEAEEAKEAREAQEAKEADEKSHSTSLLLSALGGTPPAQPQGSSPPPQEVAAFKSALPVKPSPDARLAGNALVARRSGVVVVKISCPAGESTCLGTVSLRTLVAVGAGIGGGRGSRAQIITLASGTFTVKGGEVGAVRLYLSSRARALLGRLHELGVRVIVVARDPAGATHRGSSVGTLRLQRAARS